MQFDIPKEKNSIIKVIGVGGGGGNAVNHMYKQGIKDVDFIVCNTDRQVLDASPVPLKIQLGIELTEGLGAGALPEMGRKAALENEAEIRKALEKTKMLFITAGMGGGTGTGAAPVIARIAQELGILTVSICTLPFSWEGKMRRKQAEEGLMELKKYSDSVLVILNDKIREIYHNLKVGEAFAHADNVLSSAAKCIAELINVALTINVDFNDVRRVMEKSGVAIMGSATAAGEGRSLKAVTQALNSPLLNDNDIKGARYVLVSITCGNGEDELTMDELAEITDYVQEAAGQTAEMIKGYGTNDTLGDKVSVTIIASGFDRKTTDLGLENSQPDVKMLHLEEPTPIAEVKVEQVATKKVELSEMTGPMLKTEILERQADVVQKNTFTENVSATKKNTLQEVIDSKPEEIQFEIKKIVEAKIVEPKHIEVKLEPVVNLKIETIAPVIQEVITPTVNAIPVEKMEVEAPVIFEEAIHIESTVSSPVVSEIEVAATEPVKLEVESTEIKEAATEISIIEASTSVSESAPVISEVQEMKEIVFEIAKDETKKSIEIDLTLVIPTAEKTEQPIVKVEPIINTMIQEPLLKQAVAENSEAKIEDTVTTTSKINRVIGSTTSYTEASVESKVTKISDHIPNSLPPISDNDARARAQEKIQKLRELSFKVKTPGGLAELENEPAYKRKNVMLNDTPHSSESDISRFTLSATENKQPSLRADNSFLHDKPD